MFPKGNQRGNKMTVFVHGSGKMIGQLRTVDFITPKGGQLPALAVTGDKKRRL